MKLTYNRAVNELRYCIKSPIDRHCCGYTISCDIHNGIIFICRCSSSNGKRVWHVIGNITQYTNKDHKLRISFAEPVSKRVQVIVIRYAKFLSNDYANRINKKILHDLKHKKIWDSYDINFYGNIINHKVQKMLNLVGNKMKRLESKKYKDKRIDIGKKIIDKNDPRYHKYIVRETHKNNLIIKDSHQIIRCSDKQMHLTSIALGCETIKLINSSQMICHYKNRHELVAYGCSMLDNFLYMYMARNHKKYYKVFKRITQKMKAMKSTSSKRPIRLDHLYNPLRKEVSDISKQDYLKHKEE